MRGWEEAVGRTAGAGGAAVAAPAAAGVVWKDVSIG